MKKLLRHIPLKQQEDRAVRSLHRSIEEKDELLKQQKNSDREEEQREGDKDTNLWIISLIYYITSGHPFNCHLLLMNFDFIGCVGAPW